MEEDMREIPVRESGRGRGKRSVDGSVIWFFEVFHSVQITFSKRLQHLASHWTRLSEETSREPALSHRCELGHSLHRVVKAKPSSAFYSYYHICLVATAGSLQKDKLDKLRKRILESVLSLPSTNIFSDPSPRP